MGHAAFRQLLAFARVAAFDGYGSYRNRGSPTVHNPVSEGAKGVGVTSRISAATIEVRQFWMHIGVSFTERTFFHNPLGWFRSMFRNEAVLACEPELTVGSRVRVVKGALADLTGAVIGIRGERLIVVPDFGSPGVFVQIGRSVTEIIDVGSEDSQDCGSGGL